MSEKQMIMRVVGGEYRHRHLSVPEDRNNIRPTKDRVREAIFSAINDIENKIVCDLYAGSGALGIEALSRGASKCYFVDINYVALKTIKKNIMDLAIPHEKYQIIGQCDFSALDLLKNNDIQLDVLLLDPPYAKGEYKKVIDYVKERALLSKNGIIVCESDKSLNLEISDFKKIKEYKYGDTIVTICWR